MALSTCRDCNREVSSLARQCVHCGRPRPVAASSGSIIGGIAVVVIALALTAAFVCAARKACRKMSTRVNAECRLSPEFIKCSDSFASPRAADKATFIKALESDDLDVVEVGPGLFEVRKAKKAEAPAPAPAAEPKEDRR